MTNRLETLLQQCHVLVSDGAMATELEKMGVQTDNALWSAMALITDPDAIRSVHESYFWAGAQIATTNTYQANLPALADFDVDAPQGVKLIHNAVRLADQARAGDDNLLIAGSVGPYGAYLADGSEYTGAYQLSPAEYQDFHRPRIQALVDAGVDFLALETMPNFIEVQALVALLHDEFPTVTAWVSLSVADTPTTLCDGTPLAEAAQYCDTQANVVAVGVNCTRMENVFPAVQAIHAVTAKPIVVYPNNGDQYDPTTKTWQPVGDAPQFADLVPTWLDAGARIIGGCCRTTPADIQTIKTCVDQYLAD